MEKIKIGLQIYSVREDFWDRPAETLQKVADIGYQGVELNYGDSMAEHGAELYAKELAETGLTCFSVMFGWQYIDQGRVDEVIEFCKKLKCPVIVLGGINKAHFTDEPGYKDKFLKDVKEVAEKIRAAGFKTGFHNHDVDHMLNIDGGLIAEEGGKSVFDYIFENADDDYMMLVDTGNAQGGGADPIEMIKKYPHRTEYAHFKGYSSENEYLSTIWESEIDHDELIQTLVQDGGAKVFSVEFGKRGDYVPFERAKESYQWLSAKLREKGLY